jgi:hypothetical protein
MGSGIRGFKALSALPDSHREFRKFLYELAGKAAAAIAIWVLDH